MNIAILVVASLNLVTTGGLIYLVWTGGRHIQDEVDGVKTRTNESLEAIQNACEALKF
jgi:hypothetical protein